LRTFDHVDNKLFETEFFLKRMSENDVGWFEVRCYFVSSSRSVTFAMQASMKGVEGFENWYASIQSDLREDSIARFFSECRTDDQKLGFNHINRLLAEEGQRRYYFGEPEVGRYKFVPKTDVVTTCEHHFRTVCAIVDKAYSDFGLSIDPDQIYTPTGLNSLGISLEDVEASLGFSRGWTDLNWDGADKELHRLEQLRRNIPGSSVKPLLESYLGKPLDYPTGRYRAPKNR
jgi:hypothetical protein